MIVSSERSNSDLSEYSLYQFLKNVSIKINLTNYIFQYYVGTEELAWIHIIIKNTGGYATTCEHLNYIEIIIQMGGSVSN